MKLKFTLRSSGDVDTDLVATVDGTTTVGQLAEYLVLADPARGVAPRPGRAGRLHPVPRRRGLPRGRLAGHHRRERAALGRPRRGHAPHRGVCRPRPVRRDRRGRGRPRHRPRGPARCGHGIPRSRSRLRDPAERRAGLAPARPTARDRHPRGDRPRLVQRHPGAGTAGRPRGAQERRPVQDRRDRDRGAGRRGQHRARRGPRHVAAVLAVAADRAALRRSRVPGAGAARAAQARATAVDRGRGADDHGCRPGHRAQEPAVPALHPAHAGDAVRALLRVATQRPQGLRAGPRRVPRGPRDHGRAARGGAGPRGRGSPGRAPRQLRGGRGGRQRLGPAVDPPPG